MNWNIKTASDRIGGLSKPSKMPSYGTSLPAKRCNVGARLAQVEGTTCSDCYALKGAYAWGNVQEALGRRYSLVMECEDNALCAFEWCDAFAFLLNTRLESKRRGKLDPRFFRWHDSGDLQGLFHLEMIAAVAEATPGVMHWLPTREVKIVRAFLAKHGEFPLNLNVRISAAKLDTLPPSVDGCTGSAVHTSDAALEGMGLAAEMRNMRAVSCVAYTQEGECRDCRACWDSPAVISYPKH